MPQQLMTKFIRIAREGQTIDGREIPTEHIKQMAANYDPKVYGARINKEHYVSRFWEDEFPALGDVISLKTEKDEKGKLCLLAQLAPTPKLVDMNSKGQKVYTSIEYGVDMVEDYDGAYLFGLAVTDTPASLGTEMLQFAKQKKERDKAEYNIGEFLTEPVELALDLDDSESDEPTLLSKVKELFGKTKSQSDSQFNDIRQAIEVVAEELSALKSDIATLQEASSSQQDDQPNEKIQESLNALQNEFKELKADLENTPSRRFTPRPSADGDNDSATDC